MIRVQNLILLAFGTMFFSSCLLRKPQVKPSVQMPQSYRESFLTGDSLSLPWKFFFSDEKLQHLISLSLKRNNDLEVAKLTVKQLEAGLKEAKQALLPTLDLNVTGARNWMSKNSLNGSLSEQFTKTSYLDDYNAQFRVSWEVDVWGKTAMQQDGAYADLMGNKELARAMQTRIIAQVAQAYYNLLALDEQLKIADRNLALSDSTLKITTLQYNAGQVNSLAVQQAKAQRKTAELLVPLVKQNIAIQENALSILCGEFPSPIDRKPDFSVAALNGFGSALPVRLLSRRPDVKAAEWAVMHAQSKLGLAKVAMYPSFSFTPSIGANSFKLNSWFNLPGSLAKNLAVNLTQPIFQKRSLKTAYERAALEQEKAVLQFKQNVLTAVGEVSDALEKQKRVAERLILIDEKLVALQKAAKDASLLYQNGMATYLEIITAQNNLLQTELEGTNIRLEKLQSAIDLYRSMGGGLQ
ncbi:TolC family protein [Pedobacter sp. KACC 23697]|uniref:TolC family protein n=1 Tax=Pedobacter sp. KACC 23697 TaxID=3149230 RepID=A0AAU7K016_9SPHI